MQSRNSGRRQSRLKVRHLLVEPLEVRALLAADLFMLADPVLENEDWFQQDAAEVSGELPEAPIEEPVDTKVSVARQRERSEHDEHDVGQQINLSETIQENDLTRERLGTQEATTTRERVDTRQESESREERRGRPRAQRIEDRARRTTGLEPEGEPPITPPAPPPSEGDTTSSPIAAPSRPSNPIVEVTPTPILPRFTTEVVNPTPVPNRPQNVVPNRVPQFEQSESRPADTTAPESRFSQSIDTLSILESPGQSLSPINSEFATTSALNVQDAGIPSAATPAQQVLNLLYSDTQHAHSLRELDEVLDGLSVEQLGVVASESFATQSAAAEGANAKLPLGRPSESIDRSRQARHNRVAAPALPAQKDQWLLGVLDNPLPAQTQSALTNPGTWIAGIARSAAVNHAAVVHGNDGDFDIANRIAHPENADEQSEDSFSRPTQIGIGTVFFAMGTIAAGIFFQKKHDDKLMRQNLKLQ